LRRWATGAARRDPAIEIAVLERLGRWPSACADGVVFACADGVVFTRAGGRPARSALAGAVSTACYVLAFEQDVQLWYNT